MIAKLATLIGRREATASHYVLLSALIGLSIVSATTGVMTQVKTAFTDMALNLHAS